MRKPLSSAALILGCLAILSSCQTNLNTSKASKQGIQVAGQPQLQALPENTCPRINIVEELSSLTDFMDQSDPSEYNMTSHVDMKFVESACSYEKGIVNIDLKLAFQSQLGPRSAVQPNDRPFFTYPFFVAVTNPQGQILAKEVFAASMTYERGAKTHQYFENMRQIIPISGPAAGKDHEILIGFQLNEEQLAYNRRIKGISGGGPRGLAGKQYRPINLTEPNKNKNISQ